MRILNAAQMREADRAAIHDVGIPSVVLMENAGRQVVAALESLYDDLADRRIAIVADTDDPTPPCGACRQILWEFGGDLEVILGNLAVQKATFRLAALLPHPFDARLLG